MEIIDLRLDLTCEFVTCERTLETYAKRDHVVATSPNKYNHNEVLVMIG